ncbi:hypothetical protein BpHYR1_013114 [Brachionus plicatilis]|uniref:Uncharacterized protein n=1 Tax=Brachionus plicatilis TaxID=10195 RepID=A0A3M7Q8T8_BRAPC|nr:hypothetical protein BpHYR1_013114 [Brachionus plicatilis]
MEAKKPKILVEKIEILDESTGQIILKEQTRLVYTSGKSDQYTDCDQLNKDSIVIDDFDESSSLNLNSKSTSLENLNKSEYDSDLEYSTPSMQLFEDSNNNLESLEDKNVPNESNRSKRCQHNYNSGQRIIIIDTQPQHELNSHLHSFSNLEQQNLTKKHLINSGFPAHIVQNYSILAQEITAPLESAKNPVINTDYLTATHASSAPKWSRAKSESKKDLSENRFTNNHNLAPSFRNQKDVATCQFCGRAMLKKNIPTHIRRAHTPKEELVCLNEEQNIFTFQHLKPGQRRKRSARAYDYSLMTATVSIDEDPCEGIENKFVTEGEEILSTDLLQLADRIKYGISQIPTGTLTKLIDVLTKIEYSTQDEVSSNAKSIRNMICFYLTSGEEFRYKVRQVGDDIIEKKKQVNNLRGDLKEIMARKAQLERRIQPLICELQKLEDQHGGLIESIVKNNEQLQFEILTNDTDESVN